MSPAVRRMEKIVKYGLPLLFLALSFSSGAGTFFDTRAYLYLSVTFFTMIWLLILNERGRFSLKITGIELLLALFLIAALLSAIYPVIGGVKSVNLHASLDNLFLLLSYLLFYLLISNNIRSRQEILTFVVVLLVPATLLASYGIYQHLFEFKALAQRIADGEILGLFSIVFATFTSPNHLAGFLGMLFPLSFILLINVKVWWQKALVGLAATLILVTLYLTQSRGGFVAFFFVLAVLALGIPKGKRLGATLNLSVIMGEVVLIIFLLSFFKTPSPKISTYTGVSQAAASSSLEGRLLLWQGSLEIIKDHPLIGTGIGTFGSIYPRYQVDGLYSNHAHNAFLEVFTETGIVGGILFLAFFFFVLRRQFQILRRIKDDFLRGLVLAFFAASVGFFIRNLGDFDFSVPVETLAFLAMVGLTISVERLATAPYVGADARLPAPEAAGNGGQARLPTPEAEGNGGQVPVRPEEEEVVREKTLFRQLFPIPVFLGGGAIIFIVFLGFQSFLFNETAMNFLNPMHADYDKAITFLRKAVKFNPLAAKYHSQLANAYFSKGRLNKDKSLLNKAIFHAKKATELEPYWSSYHSHLGMFLWQDGQLKRAERSLKKAEELYPNNPQPYLLLGRLYHFQKKYALASNEYQRAVSLRKHYTIWYPQDELQVIAEAHFQLGLIYERKGQLKLARKQYKKALKLNPNHPGIKKALQKLQKI